MNHFTESLKSKRLFLTGGTGLFGKWLLTSLVGRVGEVILLSRDPEGFKNTFPLARSMGVNFIHGDVRSFEYPNGDFDYCIHGATSVPSKNLTISEKLEMESVIVDGTKRVLEFARFSDIKRLLYISSGAVYGAQPPELECIQECFPCNPVSVYGKGKLRAEELCLESGLDCVIARCFSFVGPHMPLDANFAIGNFIGNCLRNEPILIKGSGKSRRSYMYSKELAEWLLQIMLIGKRGELYNVGSADSLSIEELAYLVRECAGTNPNIRIMNKNETPERNYVPDTNKAEREIELSQFISLENALTDTLKFFRCSL